MALAPVPSRLVFTSGDMVEPEANCGMIIGLAIGPVLVGIEAAARGSEAGLSARSEVSLTLFFLEQPVELLASYMKLTLESASELGIVLVVATLVIFAFGTRGPGLAAHQNCCTNNGVEEFHY